MSDLIERLRCHSENEDGPTILQTMEEAADRLATLEQELTLSRAACRVLRDESYEEARKRQMAEHEPCKCECHNYPDHMTVQDMAAHIRAETEKRKRAHQQASEAREAVAAAMIRCGLTTGHGDTLDDLLGELVAQVREGREVALEGALTHGFRIGYQTGFHAGGNYYPEEALEHFLKRDALRHAPPAQSEETKP